MTVFPSLKLFTASSANTAAAPTAKAPAVPSENTTETACFTNGELCASFATPAPAAATPAATTPAPAAATPAPAAATPAPAPNKQP